MFARKIIDNFIKRSLSNQYIPRNKKDSKSSFHKTLNPYVFILPTSLNGYKWGGRVVLVLLEANVKIDDLISGKKTNPSQTTGIDWNNLVENVFEEEISNFARDLNSEKKENKDKKA